MTDQGYRLFYRVVHENPPSLWDLTPAKGRGFPEPDDPELHAVWDGLSVCSTLAQARRRRRTSPGLGTFVAILRVPTDGSVHFARTLRSEGHHTIWCDPDDLRAMIVSIEPL
jgi:hypothetical protein